MNLSSGLALVAGTISLVTAIAHFAISRAPGYRSARRFAWIALSATCYSLANLVPPAPGLPVWAYVIAAQWNFAWAHFHILAWFPFVFGDERGTERPLPLGLRVFMGFSGAVGLLFLLTRAHLPGSVYTMTVPWAHVVVTYAKQNGLGDAYTTFVGLTILVPFVGLVRRAARGEPELWAVVAGFTVFVLCAAVEMLVAMRLVVSISPADIGFQAVVVPTSLLLLRRFLGDARRLEDLSRDLAGQVAARTEERDRARTALIEAERLAALGQLAAGVGHEVNNPLTYMRFAIDRVDRHLQSTGAPSDVREALVDALDGANRIRKVVEGLQTYSRRGGQRAAIDLREVVRAALKVANPQLRHVVAIETELGEVRPVLGEESRLVQALVNLLVNAAQALGGSRTDGRIVVRTYARGAGASVLEVQDNGPGLPEAMRSRVLEPYFTTKASQGGLGLGLFVTRGIVDAHEGQLELAGASPGTIARIVLPAHSATPDAMAAGAHSAPTAPTDPDGAAARAGASPAPLVQPRLLIVDDEPLVLQMLGGVLAAEWDVTCVLGGAEALERMAQGRFDAVVCDLMMPGTSGIDIARALESRDPALLRRIVFLTGGAVTPEAGEFLDRPDVVHLMKPVELATLEAALRSARDGAAR